MYDTEELAAQAWDRVSWVYRGKLDDLNFPALKDNYDTEVGSRAGRGAGRGRAAACERACVLPSAAVGGGRRAQGHVQGAAVRQ